MKIINLELKTNYLDEDCYVTDIIENTIKNNQSILLIAPQGVGKTTFIEKCLNNCYLISPTRALANQVNANNVGDVIANTYMLAKDYIVKNTVDFVVFDECHYIANYEMFAQQQIQKINEIYNICKQKNIKTIFVTATPQYLYCLKGCSYYDDIQVRVNIHANKQYVSNVYLYETITKNGIVKLLMKNKKDNNLQFVCINNTKLIEKIKNELNMQGIRCKSLSSANKTNEENRDIFKKLTNNEIINDLDIIIVTSWADVGINIVNDNVTDIYYFSDKEYEKWNMVSLIQFIGRTRNCTPRLHMTKPQLSKEYLTFLSMVSNNISSSVDAIVLSLAKDGTNSNYYDILLNSLKSSYQIICDEINYHGVDKRCARETPYIFEKTHDWFVVNEVVIKLHIHKLIDVCKLTVDINKLYEYFIYNEIKQNSKMIKLKDIELTEMQMNRLINLFDICAKLSIVFSTQNEIKRLISNVIGYEINNHLSSFIKLLASKLNIEMEQTRSNGKTKYKIKYIDGYYEYRNWITGEIPHYLMLKNELTLNDKFNIIYQV